MKKANASAVKPRNPFVAAARFRQAGAHTSRAMTRQSAQLRLRKELLNLDKGP